VNICDLEHAFVGERMVIGTKNDDVIWIAEITNLQAKLAAKSK
jgi:hypothetical protein